ncbi:MAG: F0F1 ATP synthase subunit delta [bacterium]|nr:F0F1 ATP synthase subunit delta [bacterium]
MGPQKAVHALREILVARGREVLFPRIAKAFERIAVRESNRADVTLHIADEKDERHARSEAKKALAEMKLDTGITNIKIDGTLVGGWRLESGEHLLDNSYKRHLLNLYNNVISSTTPTQGRGPDPVGVGV